MGCDIHPFLEKKIDGKWQAVGEMNQWGSLEEYEPLSDRDYYLFSILAGVRNHHSLTPIAPPKGLPDDMSPEVERLAVYWEDCAHNESWLSYNELDSHDYDQYEYENWEVIEKKVIPDMQEIMKEVEDVRIVFWFDS